MTSSDLCHVSIVLLFLGSEFFSAHVFTRLNGAEYVLPATAEIEDRHVKDKHGIVSSFPPLKNSSPAPRGVSARSFDSLIHFQ